MLKRFVIFSLCSFFVISQAFGSQLSPDDLTVLREPADEMMFSYLSSIIDQPFADRDARLARLKTKEDWERRSEEIRSAMQRWVRLPDRRTPLNARVTGRLEKKDYLVEKILFESRPHFYVSASLYLPKNISGKRPAILNVLGHNSEGKGAADKQRRCIAQAKKGFVALIIDGIGQGERKIEGYSIYGSFPGAVHRTVGAQAFLAGTHLFGLMVWDAIRAVDYLCSRTEVDSERIGITGTSGGGLMSTYILPFEPRIKVSVPACNPNTWSHRVRANLSTDHEQVFFGAFREGIDPRGDPLFAHVPKPLLINATSEDNLNPPRGVWALHSWLYRAYAAYGHPERLQTTMVKAPHAYNQEQREIAYAWMLRWLGGDVSNYLEGAFPVESESELWCTATGDLYAIENSLEPHDLVRSYYSQHKAQLQTPESESEVRALRANLAQNMNELLGYSLTPGAPAVETMPTVDSGRRVRKRVLKPEEGIVLPAVWVEPSVTADGRVVLYLHEEGKEALLADRAVVGSLLDEGVRILAVDLRGTGETAPGKERYFWDFLAGKPIFGQRASDVLSVLTWMSQQGVDMEQTKIWAQGLTGLYAATACLHERPVGGVILEDVLISFEDVIQRRLPQYNHEILLPGVVTKFDLPDLYSALCPMKLSLMNPLLADKTPAGREDLEKAFERTKQTYGNLGVQESWSVVTGVEGSARSKLLLQELLNP
jgi:dienelactone hydrolase